MCHAAASTSEQSPRTAAHIDTAADSAEVIARWIPEEKNGSMNAEGSRISFII